MDRIELDDIEEFISMVGKMRAHQRAYFQTREREKLMASKDCEAAVDRWLEDRADRLTRLF